jgi:hypothetical protein
LDGITSSATEKVSKHGTWEIIIIEGRLPVWVIATQPESVNCRILKNWND